MIANRLVVLVLMYFVLAALALAAGANAQDRSGEPVMLVAKPGFQDRLYGATILIARPIGNGQHIGFIVNRPTQMTLGIMFPDHGPSQKVVDPVYLGGPVNIEMIFALVQRRTHPDSRALQLTSDLYLVVERELVDHVIEAEADHARFFAGVVLWQPGELRAEIEQGIWYVQDADSDLVLRKSTEGLWEELVKRSERGRYGIAADASDGLKRAGQVAGDSASALVKTTLVAEHAR
jgi:putative transcriptional regulator